MVVRLSLSVESLISQIQRTDNINKF
jgi:hypothetical protein